MLGIYGCIQDKCFDLKNIYDEDFLSKNYASKNYIKESFIKDNVQICNLKLHHMDNKFFSDQNVVIFVNGSCYNISQVAKINNLDSCTIEELLFTAYKENILKQVLNKLDGIFCACIYDIKNKKIFLISDRFGVKYFYYYFKDGHFAFAPEVKKFLSSNIDKTINKMAFDCFMELGYLLEDNTWFENIKLIKPSSILEFDIKNKTLEQNYYWTYSEIKQQKISFEDAVDKLSKLFVKSIKKRYNPKKEICVPISGGLDSRMIAASFDKIKPTPNLNFVTFGQENCFDFEASDIIAKKMKQKHKFFILDNEDVIDSRKYLLWEVDGLFSIMHMHGMNNKDDDFHKNIEVVFSGGIGGEVFGCTYKPKDGEWNKIPNKNSYSNIYKKQINNIDLNMEYYNIEQYHPNVITNALRKFTFASLQYSMRNYELCLPFLDNDMIEFIFSIDESYRKDYNLYFNALKKAFPYFYSIIPLQRRIGCIKESFIQKISREIKNKINDIKHIKQQNHFFDYNEYIKKTEIQNKILKILNTENKFLSDNNLDFIKQYMDSYYDIIKFHPDSILKLVSVKLYFDILSEKLNNRS